MADLRELYQSVILDHSRTPRNSGPLPDATATGSGNNPMCGDLVVVQVRMDGDTIADVRFTTPPGVGCAVSKASASMMTAAVRGKSRAEADALFERFHAMVTGGPAQDVGHLAVFAGVAQFPIRVKCATLAWHALRSALHQSETATP